MNETELSNRRETYQKTWAKDDCQNLTELGSELPW